jgi:Fanconi-associated nuclease 1
MALEDQSCNRAPSLHTNHAMSRDDKESAEPPLKRVKSGSGSDSESDLDGWTNPVEVSQQVTDVESCLAPVRIDQESIEDYESSQAAAQEISVPDAENRLDQRNWVRGRSSIYVDAFNLALDTVLDEESHLFNAAEQAVFANWKTLSYEAQYL